MKTELDGANLGGEPAPTTPDPIEMAMEQLSGDNAPDSVARRLLERSVLLTDEQIALARHDMQQRRLQVFSERITVVSKCLLAFAGVILAGLLGFMVWDAAHTRSVIVEPFSVPPEMAARGLNGQVLASRMIDTLTRLRDETIAPTVPLSYGGEKAEEVRLEIPQTGVSLGELQAFLRNWLGRETRITGEVTSTGDKLQLSVRAAAQPGDRVEMAVSDVDGLLTKGAEQIYKLMEPERYGSWLTAHNRQDEAIALIEKMSVAGSRKERARAFGYWAQTAEDGATVLDKAQQALALDPELPIALENISYGNHLLGRDQQALADDERMLKSYRGRRGKEYAPWHVAMTINQTEGEIAEARGDLLGAARFFEKAGDPSPDQPVVACRVCAGGSLTAAAVRYALIGDGYNAGRVLKRGVEMAKLPAARAALRHEGVRVRMKVGIEDWSGLAALFDTPAGWDFLSKQGVDPTTQGWIKAQVLARLGRGAEAMKLAEPLPADCYPCSIARGMAAAAMGDARRTEAEFAKALALAPDLPTAGVEHARALLARGQADAAIAALKKAKASGPRAAELELLWGRALMAKGDAKGAAKHYAEAAEYAPRLGRLRILWGEALARAGDRAGAEAQWRTALGFTLTLPDRARTERLLNSQNGRVIAGS